MRTGNMLKLKKWAAWGYPLLPWIALAGSAIASARAPFPVEKPVDELGARPRWAEVRAQDPYVSAVLRSRF